MEKQNKLITIAIHTYEKAVILKTLLEKEGIKAVLHNVNLIQPVVSSGVRVRIHEEDLPLALKIIESSSILKHSGEETLGGNTVLVPVDFSEYSDKACAIGFDFAYRLGGEVVLFHTFLDQKYAGIFPLDSDEYESNPKEVASRAEVERCANEKMDNLKDEIKHRITEGHIPDVEFTSIVTEGVPENEIIDYSKEIRPVVIVMGTRGKNKKEADLMGSVTAEVLDADKYPVFTVPENMTLSHIDEISNVIFFSNLRRQDLLSFDVFARLFNKQDMNVTIVPIVEKNETEVTEGLDALLRYCNQHYRLYKFKTKVIDESSFIEDFNEFVKSSKVDLIVIPNKKKNIFTRLFKPSVAHKMLFHYDTAMLVVPV